MLAKDSQAIVVENLKSFHRHYLKTDFLVQAYMMQGFPIFFKNFSPKPSMAKVPEEGPFQTSGVV